MGKKWKQNKKMKKKKKKRKKKEKNKNRKKMKKKNIGLLSVLPWICTVKHYVVLVFY